MRATADIDAELGALLERCAVQDRPALEALYRRTAAPLLGCLLRILRRRALAEEALQDLFVQVWQRAGQFDAHRGRPWTWLVSMARYRAIDILRREREDATDPTVLADTLEAAPDPDDPAAADDALASARDLEFCLQQLGSEQRDCIRLAFIEGRAHPEVATALNRPLGSVKSWIRRGLVALRECIEACGSRTRS